MAPRVGQIKVAIRGEHFLHAAMADCAPRLALAFSEAIQRAVNPSPAQVALDEAEAALKLAAANLTAASRRATKCPESLGLSLDRHRTLKALDAAAIAWAEALQRCPEV